MGALDGLLVISIEQAVAAPTCTVRLADAGARVIKIEREGGETARNYDRAVQGTSSYFAWLNRGKESVVLNLKDQDERALLLRMLSKADVFVQNMVPGALDRMGLTKQIIERDFPQLIAVSIVGYGQDTPYADMRAYDMLVQAESGVCAITGTPETPVKVGVSVADITTGMNAHAAILEALIERSKTGRGKVIEMAMFDGMADWMAVPLLLYEHAGQEAGRHGFSHFSIHPYRPYECLDGTIIIAIQTNVEWQRLCEKVLEREELATDPDYATNPQRSKNRNALDREIEPAFASMTLETTIERLKSANIAYARFTELPDLGSHPALRRTEVAIPGDSSTTLPRPAGRNDDFTPGPVPALGEHTAAIREEFS